VSDNQPETQPRLDAVDPIVKTALATATPERPDVLICCPLAEEFLCVRNELRKRANRVPSPPYLISTRYHAVFEVGLHVFWLVQSGLGAKSCNMAQELLKAIEPDAFCLIGFAGALDRSFLVGDVVEPAVVRTPSSSRSVMPAPLGLTTSTETMVTASKIAATPAEKTRLRDEFQASVVDMEAFAVGRVCEEHGIPFHTARSISDAADEEFPKELNGIILPNGDLSMKRLIWAMMKKPTLVKPLYRLWKNSRKAKEGLRLITRRLVEKLA